MPVIWLVTTRSMPPRAAEIGQGDFGGAEADGHVGLPGEVALAVAKVDRGGAVARVADDQVEVAVAVEVGRDDLGGEQAGRECSVRHELARLVDIECHGVVLKIDAGEHRAGPGGDDGDGRARGDRG